MPTEDKPTNGDRTNGILAAIPDKIIRALPPAMLLLVLLNICFLGVAAWVFQHNTDIRNQMITRIIDSCLQHQKDTP